MGLREAVEMNRLTCANAVSQRPLFELTLRLQRRGHWFDPSTAHGSKTLVTPAFLDRMYVRISRLLAPRSLWVPKTRSRAIARENGIA